MKAYGNYQFWGRWASDCGVASSQDGIRPGNNKNLLRRLSKKSARAKEKAKMKKEAKTELKN